MKTVKKKITIIFRYILILIVLFSFGYLGYIISGKVEAKRFTTDLQDSLVLYGDWVLRNQTKKGDFNYELSVQTGSVLSGYNIVRQAGTLYSLCHTYRYTMESKYKEGIEKGIDFFEQYYEEVDYEVPTIKITHEGDSKSNTVALYLLALIEYMESNAQAKREYMDTANALANYLLYTQNEEGGFWQFYDEKEESDYNNGESFYALIRMYKVSGDERYLDGAKKAGEYIIEKYTHEKFNYSVYAWAMEGFGHLYDVQSNQKYWDFMKSYTEEYLNSGGKNVLDYLEGDCDCTPPKANLGVYLEGMAHVAWIAKQQDPEYYTTVLSFIEDSLGYLMTLQINGPRATRTTEYALIYGGICYDYECTTQRIDITHHNLSSIYLYFKYAR